MVLKTISFFIFPKNLAAKVQKSLEFSVESLEKFVPLHENNEKYEVFIDFSQHFAAVYGL